MHCMLHPDAYGMLLSINKHCLTVTKPYKLAPMALTMRKRFVRTAI